MIKKNIIKKKTYWWVGGRHSTPDAFWQKTILDDLCGGRSHTLWGIIQKTEGKHNEQVLLEKQKLVRLKVEEKTAPL